MAGRKIEAWYRAGIIDDATRDRLIAFEADHARPVALWAVFGLGALTIGLGLVSVVAANWEDIPGLVRLGVHLGLIAGALGVLLLREERLAAGFPWAAEALLFVVIALGLTFFGHLGQVYQTSSPLWQPVGLWLMLFAPLLLLMGRGSPTAASLMVGLLWFVWGYVDDISWRDGRLSAAGVQALWLAFVTAAPLLLAPLAAWMRARSGREEFWRRLEQAALGYGVAGASLASGIAGFGAFDDGEPLLGWGAMIVRGGVGLAAGLGLVAARRSLPGRMSGLIMAGAGLTAPLALLVNGLDVAAALLFMVLWAGIAAAALAAGWRGVFQLAVTVIALRIIVLSFELASDLLLSGFGLILSGALIIGIAAAAFKVSRTFAPPAEGKA